MRLLRLALARFRALFRRNAIADEIRDEMRFHVDMRTADFRARGLPETDARRAASRRFGNLAVMADRGYDIRGGGMLETIWQDVRYAVRTLSRQRGFALVTILTLAVAMGASTALFSVIDAALLRPVPYPDAERIVYINVEVPQSDGRAPRLAPSVDDLERWRSSSDVFDQIGRGRVNEEPLIIDAGEPQRLQTSSISPGFLEVFGVAPLAGRGVLAEDALPGAPSVVWLGYDFWMQAFDGRGEAVGATLRVGGEPATIVGVLPRGFYRDSAVWRAMPADAGVRRGSGTPTYGRLARGITIEDATGRLTAVLTATADSPGAAGARAHLTSMYESTVNRYRSAVRFLAGAVAIVLLIACINVAGLLLARGATRQAELAVRASMGAGRLRLVRQLVTESLVIAAVGGTAGIVVAWLMLDGLVAVLPISLPPNVTPAINLTVLGFGALLSLVVTLLFGLFPAIRLSRVHLGPQLSRAGRRHTTALTRRGGQTLVAAEVALALVLLMGAGLMVRSFSKALSVDVGFDPDAFVTMEVYPADADPASHAPYFRQLLDTLRAQPSLTAVGATTLLPMGGGAFTAASTDDGQRLFASVRSVTPGYLEAIGAVPLRGRLMSDADVAMGPVAVLAEDAARELFPDGSAVGRPITIGKVLHTVVGVVPDVRNGNVLYRDPERERDVYLSLAPDSDEWSSGAFGRRPVIVVRPDRHNRALGEMLRQAAQSVGPPAIVGRIRTGSDLVGDNLEQPRNRTILLGLIGGLGLALTLVGVFGITAYTVARRTHEVGIRMAFGARPVDVVRRMVTDAAWPVAAGVIAGVAGAWYASRFIESFLYETPPHEPVTFAIVAIATAVVAILAAWIPARRAAKVDPVIALRTE